MNIIKFIPKEQLTANKKKVSEIVKATPLDELHATHSKMITFMSIFTEVVKERFIKACKEKKKKEGTGRIILGKNSYVEYGVRNSYEYDEKAINKFLRDRKIHREEIFDTVYRVVGSDKKVLDKLVEQGILSKEEKLNPKKIEELVHSVKDGSKILKFIKVNTTEFVKGL